MPFHLIGLSGSAASGALPLQLLLLLPAQSEPTPPAAPPVAVAQNGGAQDGAAPGGDGQDDGDLTRLSLEELMNVNVEVTSVARKPQSLSKAPAAVYVLTAEDIRRSGATSVPEALRLVPGLDVARINGNTWAISARGFNAQYANKLLVLIDGRSVYTPLFSGTYWDVQDVVLEDVERIEVIRGPGAAMWGANAVNGVINVITKSAAETQGGLFSAVVGSEERVIDTLRYGVPAGDCGFLRVYGKWSEHDSLHQTSASVADDGWQQGRVGMRGDWNPTTKDAFTVLGDAYRGSFDGSVLQNSPTAPFQQTVAEDGFASGANLIGRWTRTSDPHSSATLQFFVDTYRRESTGTSQQIDTQDLDYQQHLRLNDWNDVTFGMGYRRFETKFRGTFDVALQDPNSYDDVTSAFVQDDLTLVKERLTLSLGSKFEYNDFTHFEPQPDARLVYTPDEKQTWWAAASRAVRTPSVIEDDGKLSLSVQPGAPPTQVELYGNPALHAENVTAYQLGWRVRPSETTSLDLTAFFNEYSRLVTFETGTPFLNANGNLEVPQTFGNEMHGRTEGIEAAGEWRVAPSWTLHAGYAFLAIHVETSPSSTDTTSVHETSSSFPDHQVQLRSLWNVTDKVEFDVGVTYVDSVPQYGAPAYVRADARLGWRISDRTDLSLTAQSLFHDDQPEFGAQLIVVPTEPQTGIYLKFTHRF